MIKEGIYMIEFDNKEDLETFKKLEVEDVVKRCYFKTSKSASVYIHKRGYFNLLLEGHLPVYVKG
ncbi:MAG: hypothetical protein ACOYMA_00030 [Bacteroidia bacterium]